MINKNDMLISYSIFFVIGKFITSNFLLTSPFSFRCISMVGRDFQKPGAQPLSLADDCLETGIILHELMHSLGFWHEQSRPDRDSYVEIFWENMEPG